MLNQFSRSELIFGKDAMERILHGDIVISLSKGLIEFGGFIKYVEKQILH